MNLINYFYYFNINSPFLVYPIIIVYILNSYFLRNYVTFIIIFPIMTFAKNWKMIPKFFKFLDSIMGH